MKRLTAVFVALFLAGTALAQFPIYEATISYLLAGTTSVAYSNYWASGGTVKLFLDDDDQNAFVKFSKDYILDGDFENDPRDGIAPYDNSVSPANKDMWDSDGALQGSWTQSEGTGGSVEVTTTELFGEDSLLFDASGGTAVVEMGTNMVLDTDLTGWTVNVNAGSGTGASSGAAPLHTAGGEKLLITGGSAHVDVTQAVAVVAATEYFVTFWWTEAAGDDLCDFRIQESTGGTDYLQANGTWAAGAVDIVTTDGDSSAAYEHGVVTFTTDTGITGVTLWFAADVTGDICSVDDVSMALAPGTFIQTTTMFPVLDTAADSYAIVANHQDGGTDSVLQVQLIDAETGSADPTTLYWDGTSDWTSTETWVSCTNANVTTTQCIETFLAHDAALTTDHRVRVKFRALMGTAEDITLDNVFLVETTTVNENIPLIGVGGSGDAIEIELEQGVKGRFVVDASGTIGIFVLGTFFAGS